MWYKTLGFKQYPLDPRSNTNLIGVEEVEKKLKHFIQQGNMCMLSGYTGSGKTSMLQRICKDPSLKQFRFVYVSADGVRRDYIIEDAVRQSVSFVQRLLRKKPKNLVIMLDESHLANRILTESIKSMWNVQYPDGTKAIQSVIVSQIEDRLGTNFSGSFADRLGKRVLKMPKLSDEQLLEVLRSRLELGERNFVGAFDPLALEMLTSSAGGSVRQLLEYTDAIFTHHEELEGENPLLNEDYAISKEVVFNTLQSTGLIAHDRLNKKEEFQRLFSDNHLSRCVDMFVQFGALSSVDLAEKLDVQHNRATGYIEQMIAHEALERAHTDDGRDYFVLTPRLQHEVTKA